MQKKIKIKDLYDNKELLKEFNINVETPSGFFKILDCDETYFDKCPSNITTETGKNITVSMSHNFKNELNNYESICAIPLRNIGKVVKTKDGIEKVIKYIQGNPTQLYDIQVEGVSEYYSNDIVSHNSNILNAVTYGLFGQTFDTLAREKNRDNKFINHNNKKDYAQIKLFISINDENFLLIRRTERKWNRTKDELTGVSTKIQYFKLNENLEIIDENNLNDQDKIKTQKVIEETIGDLDEFINKSLVNSDTLNQILTADHAKFLDSILKDTGLDIFDKKLNEYKNYKKSLFLKESKLNISVEDYNLNISDLENTNIENNNFITEIEKEIKLLEERIKNGEVAINALYQSLHVIDKKFINFDILNIKKEITILFEDIANKTEQKNNLLQQYNEMLKFSIDENEYNKLKEEEDEFSQWSVTKKLEIKDLNNKIAELQYKSNMNNGYIKNITIDIENINKRKEKKELDLKDKISHIQKSIDILVDSKNCPTCNQEIKDKEHIKSISDKVAELNQQISEIQLILLNKNYLDEFIKEETDKKIQLDEKISENTSNKNEIGETENKITLFNREIDNKSLKNNKLNQKITEFDLIKKEIIKRDKIKQDYELIPLQIENSELKINQKNELILEYDKNIVNIEKNIKINEKIDKYQIGLNQIKSELTKKVSEKQNLLFSIEKNKTEIQNKLNVIDKYLKQQRQDAIYNEYENCIHRDGIPSILLKRLIPRVNEFLLQYMENVDFDVFFDNDLNFMMSKKESPEIIYSVISGSGMERVFACICLRLALRYINIRSRPDFLLFDELFGKLSEKNALNFVSLMNKIKEDIDKIVIIEHSYGDILNPDHIIQVSKDENNNSVIEIS